MGNSFGIGDYIVFVVTLLTSLAIGIYFAILDKRKDRNSPDEYFLAGRKSKLLPVAISFIVSFQSSVLILAFPVEVYSYGMIFSLYAIGLAASYVFAGLIFVPVIYPLKITSVNKYFYLRYGDNLVRYLAVFTQVVYNVFYMGTVMFGTCVATEVILNIPYWVTVFIYAIVTTVYTSIGGIKAVIWTDVFQFLIMIAGISGILIKSTVDAGGANAVLTNASDRIHTWDLRLNPTIRYTVWNICFGSFTQTLYLCVSQPGIQRVNSTPCLRDARIMYIISGPIYGIILAIVSFEGVTLFGYYASKGCDILEGGVVNNVNEMVPFAVSELFKGKPGVNGLFLASLSSAALSTISSSLSSLSAITYDDAIRVRYPNIDDARATFLSKIVVLVYGLIGMAVTFVIAKLPGSIMNVFQGLIGCIDGPTAAIFVVSIFFKRATSKGVFIGAIFGMATSFWLIMGKTLASLPPDTTLPPGATDQCWIFFNSSEDNISALIGNVTNDPIGLSIDNDSTSALFSNMSSTDSVSQLSVVERLYSVSYMLISLIAFLVTAFISILSSLCTRPKTSVDDIYLFSFSKHILGGRHGKGREPAMKSQEDIICEEMNDLLETY